MIPKSKLHNKTLAIVAVNLESEEKDDIAVFSGKINLKDDKIYFNRDGKDLFEITEWQERINLIHNDLKDILLDCKYYLMLSTGNISDYENSEDYIATGLKWPQED